MPASVSGDNSLNFTAKLEIGEYRKGIQDLKKETESLTVVAIEGTKREEKARQAQIGAIERVKAKIKELNTEREKATAANLPAINKDLEAYTKELARLRSIGTDAFAAQNKEASKFIPLLSRMRQAADIYKKGIDQATNVENIAKYRQRLEQINKEIERLGNVGKRGFDELGRPIKEQQGLIEKLERQVKLYKKGIQEATNTANIEKYNQKLKESQAELAKLQALGERTGKVQLGTLQRLQKAAELYKNAAASTQNPELIQKYNRKLQETEVQIQRTSNIGKKGFDELGNKIKGSTNVAGKLFGQLRFIANILPGVGIAGLIGLITTPIIQAISELDIFKKKLNESQKAAVNLSEAFGSGEYQKAVVSVNELRNNVDLAKKGFLDKADVVRQYNEGIGETIGQVKTLAEVENALTKSGDAYIKMTLLKAAANLSLEKAAQKALEQEQERLKDAQDVASTGDQIIAGLTSFGGGVFDIGTYATNLAVAGEQRRKKNIEQAKKDQAQNEKIAADFQKQAAELAKKYGFDFFDFADPKKTKSNADQIAKLRESLLRRIDEINKEYSRKSLTSEEEELQRVRDRFMKIRAEVEKFNKNNPKLAIGLAGLNETEQKALADLRYRQETERLKIALAEQQGLYRQFEEYRNTFGEKAAEERFRNELDLSRTYYDKINEELYNLNRIPEGSRSGAQQERIKALTELRNTEIKEQQKTYSQLASQLTDYEQKRTLITEKFNRDRDTLLKEGNVRAVAELEKAYKQDIDNLDDANAEKLEAFRRLFEGVDELSTKQGLAVVEIAENRLKELVAQGRISESLRKEIEKLLKSTRTNLAERLPRELGNLGNALGNIANQVGGIDDAFGNLIGTLGNVLTNVGQIGNSLAAIKKAQETGSILDGLTGGLGIVSAGFSIIQGIEGFFSARDAKERAQREAQQNYSNELQLKAIEAQTKAMERQLLLIKELYGTQRITEYGKSLDELTQRYNEQVVGLEGRFLLTGSLGIDEIIGKVNNGQKLSLTETATFNLYKRLVEEGKKTLLTIDPILKGLGDIGQNSKSIEELQRLLDQGKLDSNTASRVEELIKLGEQYRETFNAIREELTGTNINSLVDELASLFEQGLTPAAEEFGDNFEKIMKRSIINSFKRQFLETQLQGFYEAFANASQSGGQLTEQEIADLRELYNSILLNAQAGIEQLKDISGIDFGADAEGSDPNSLKGDFRNLTEDTGNRLLGSINGIQISVNRIANHLEGNKSLGLDTFDVLQDSYGMLTLIERNTRNTHLAINVSNEKLQLAVNALNSIDTGVRSTTEAVIATGG